MHFFTRHQAPGTRHPRCTPQALLQRWCLQQKARLRARKGACTSSLCVACSVGDAQHVPAHARSLHPIPCRMSRVVWSIRGTRYMVDLLTDLCSIHPVTQVSKQRNEKVHSSRPAFKKVDAISDLTKSHPTLLSPLRLRRLRVWAPGPRRPMQGHVPYNQ